MKKILALLLLAGSLLGLSHRVVAADAPVITDEDLKWGIDQWPLDQQIGQLFISRTPADAAQARADVAQYHLGGLILFGRDLEHETAAQTLAKVQTFQGAAETPLLIATDQEGGTVSRLNSSATFAAQRYLSPQAAYAAGGMAAVLAAARTQAQALKQLGVNWNFAPIADVTTDPQSFIYSRTLGRSYAATADYIRQVIPAIQGNGVAATLKHFPGYGSAADTHTQFATVTKSLAALDETDLLPFQAGVAAGADAIMVTHIVMQALDDQRPASLSHAVITDLLRKQLGFTGVVITDDLAMGAIEQYRQAQGLTSADLLAVQAGNDAIMADDYAVGIPQIKQAVATGQLDRKVITAADLRLLQLKRKLGLLSPAQWHRELITVAIAKTRPTQVTVTGTVPTDFRRAGARVIATRDNQTVQSVSMDAQGRFTMTLKRTTHAQAIKFEVTKTLSAEAKMRLEGSLMVPAKAPAATATRAAARPSQAAPAGSARQWGLALGLGVLGTAALLWVWRRRM